MSTNEVRAVVDGALAHMRRALSMERWDVHMVYEPLPGGTMGQCAINMAHQHATITIDPASHDDEAAVLDTLLHEFLHLAHGYFEVARKVAAQYLDENAMEAADVGFELGAEQTVLAFQLILERMGVTVEKLLERGRELEAG